MSAFDKSKFPTLFANRLKTRDLTDTILRINRVLPKEYEELVRCAPSRSDRKKRYFVCSHDGNLSGDGPSNRFEERLAIALWELGGHWSRPGGGRTRLLDYQVPWKPKGHGRNNIDLVGVTETGRLVIVELKIKPKRNSRGDVPLKALLQGLRYAAIASANQSVIIAEAKKRFDVAISDDPPIVQLLAPKAWWRGWTDMANRTRNDAGNWEPAFVELIRNIDQRLGVYVECLALADVGPDDIDCGRTGNRPRLRRVPSLYPVTGETLRIGEALPSHRNGEDP